MDSTSRLSVAWSLSEARTAARRDTWTIWLAREERGERMTLEKAIELACDSATVHRKPAWLLDETADPLKPIERR